jgi:hypothetical protein
LFLFFHQRELVLHVEAISIRTTGRGTATHKIARVVVMPEPDRMAQLVGYEVAGYVG